MCGRYFVDDEMMRKLRQTVGGAAAGPERSRQDVFPSQEATVLAERRGGIRAVTMLWGFPKYAGNGLIINARSETAMESAMFRESLLKRRCVIPAGGFYEWNRNREMAVFRSGSVPILYMAGFYNIFGDQFRYVILTTGANSSVSPVHSRMPLILEENEIKNWIQEADFAEKILRKTPGPLVKEQEYEQQVMMWGQ